MKPFETKNNLLKPVSATSRYQQHGSPCLHEPVWLLTIAKNRLSQTLQATVFNVVNSARKMSTYLGIMSTMSGRLSTNSGNDCQPHLEKSRKLSTEIRKRQSLLKRRRQEPVYWSFLRLFQLCADCQ